MDGGKIALQSVGVANSLVKDLYLYFRERASLINRLEDNFQKLDGDIRTINSRRLLIKNSLAHSVNKKQTDEFTCLEDKIERIKNKHKKYLTKYEKYTCKTATKLQEVDDASTSKVLQNRKLSVWTSKFWVLAALSKHVSELHEDASQLINNFNEKFMTMETELNIRVKHGPIYDLPQLNENVDTILSHLKRADVKLICIVGPIGVGKTTVLAMLDNKLKDTAIRPLSDNETEIVIWIDYPSGMDTEPDKIIGDIQNEIMLKLKIIGEKTTSINENANRICKYLCDKKYTLLMDQVSSSIDLVRIGIHKEHEGKIVVAARTKKITYGRTIDRVVEVRKLSDLDGLKLFENFYGLIRDTRLKYIADLIVPCCGGLPQVIIIVADHLKLHGNNDEGFWHNVKTQLQSNPDPETLGLGPVGKAYELMYDDLKEDYVKKCSIYGALFPSEQKIYKDYLIECWKSEGFLHKEYIKNLRAERGEGTRVLNELTSRYLLEFCTESYVKIPVHFRKVALAKTYPGEQDSKMWVAGSINELPKEEGWSATRMSSIGRLSTEEIKKSITTESNLPKCPNCSNISTLLLQRNPRIQKLDDCFFQQMESLKVLDLHRTPIISLPISILHLKNLVTLYLNGCSHLTVLPDEVGNLLKLEILDIRRTSITPWLPKQIGSMVRLRCLRVSFDHKRCNGSGKGKEIMTSPSEIISKLIHLEELVIETDLCSDDWKNTSNEIVNALASLEHLTTLHFNFPTGEKLHYFIRNSKSWNDKSTDWGKNTYRSFKFFVGGMGMSTKFDSDICGISAARHLRFSCTGEETSSRDLEVLDQVSAFELIGHPSAKSLSELNSGNMGTLKACVIGDCDYTESVVDVHGKNPMAQGHTESTRNHPESTRNHPVLQCLEKLILFNLQSLQQIWTGSFIPESLSSLIVLKLRDCPVLTEIIPEIWITLKEIEIIRCIKLVKLSMTRENAKNLASITCEASWWSNVELQGEEDKQYFSRFCHFRDPDSARHSQTDVSERNPEKRPSNGICIVPIKQKEVVFEENTEFGNGTQSDNGFEIEESNKPANTMVGMKTCLGKKQRQEGVDNGEGLLSNGDVFHCN